MSHSLIFCYPKSSEDQTILKTIISHFLENPATQIRITSSYVVIEFLLFKNMREMYIGILLFGRLLIQIQVIKSSSAAGHTRHRLGNTSTYLYVCFDIQQIHHQMQDAIHAGLATQAHVHSYGHMLVLSSFHLVCPAADDGFVVC